MKKAPALIAVVLSALFAYSCAPTEAPYRFPPQILVPMPIPSTFTPTTGGPAVDTIRVYIGMAPAAGYFLVNGGSVSALQPMPGIDDGRGNTWIPTEMYVTGTNLVFYMMLQVEGDPSRTQLVMTLLQQHNYSATMPKTPPYDLSVIPISEIPPGTSYSLATAGNSQGHTEENIHNGAFDF